MQSLLIVALMAFAPTAKTPAKLIVLNKANNTAWIVDMEANKRIMELQTEANPNEVAVSPDGKTAVISNMGGAGNPPGTTLSLVDIEAAKITGTVKLGENGAPHGITFLAKDRIAVTSHVTDSVNEIDLTSKTTLRTLKTEQRGTHLAVFDAGFKNCYTVNAFSGSVTAMDFATGKIMKQIPTGAGAEGISISPNGEWIACGNLGADTVSLIRTKTLAVEHTIEKIGKPIRTHFTPDGKHLMVSSLGSGAVEVYETQKWQKTATVVVKAKGIANPQYGDQWPAPMNFYQRKNGNVLVVLVTSHAVAEIDLKTWKAVKWYDTGGIPDGIAVSE